MGNLHGAPPAVRISEDFSSEAPCLLLLQSAAGHSLPDSNSECLVLLNLLRPGLKHYIFTPVSTSKLERCSLLLE